MIIDGIVQLLKTDAGVAALVAARVSKNSLPRGYSFPAIAVHRYAGTQDYDFSGPTGIREDQIQLDVYSQGGEGGDVKEAVRALLDSYKGTLPDGTQVQACFLERDMDMPFIPNSDRKGIADRAVLGYRVVSART